MSRRPNILFVQSDQQRPDWLEMNPAIPVRSPHLRALGERGRRFTHAICPSPLCAPSRACLASGLEYDRCRVWGNETYFPEGVQTYHQRLRDEAGYHVMAAGKHHVGNNQSGNPPRLHRGIDGREGIEEWGFSDAIFNAGLNQATILMRRNGGIPQDTYMTYLQELGLAQIHLDDYTRRNQEGVWTATFPTSLPDEAYFDSWITRNAKTLIDRAPADQPWYLEVNLQNPHHPWDVTESMHDAYRNPPVDFPPPEHCTLDISPQTHQEIRRNWAATVEHLDDCLGQLLTHLAQRGCLDDTIVVYSSDHGEMLGDYNQFQKVSPLQASAGVPLVIAGPGVTHRGVDGAPMTILDLASTFIEWSGLTPSADMDSLSLASYLRGETQTHRPFVFSGLSAWRMVTDGQFKLIRGYDPVKRSGGDTFEPTTIPAAEVRRLQGERPELLFDLTHNECEDTSAQNPEALRRLQQALDDHLAVQ
ncbi:MAG: sulfatase-like hydrolase/transferase [Gemmatimonadetes bacterium]|jgi:arylsulfatase|nr:sulfatase-like hydrolase/transferase [Gemmatimonadota bacterium]MBT4610529.1 sulfatase-like hydrolase/transferase [Gemmatimonadota bacterium]MBT5059594.1 sulfatase-like hydrolase/transferase [Gemmatimonadota bacterium]MBT5144659.1 sulfatase-like hydrolase/transferase [Gemmatimonadota bacterium]MBT5587380.1 sulfatase-like hydrolase/transferase [Gemmatimonadota bacterium]